MLVIWILVSGFSEPYKMEEIKVKLKAPALEWVARMVNLSKGITASFMFMGMNGESPLMLPSELLIEV